MMAPAPIRIWVSWDEHSADFHLSVTSVNEKGEPLAQLLGPINVDDPKLGQRLRDTLQSFRMGIRYADTIQHDKEMT